ncbi:hypothetical protein JCM15124A_06970 [Prevotella falsenii]
MNRLFVYGDFDWLEHPLLIGELSYESLRGADSYAFMFDKDRFAKYGYIFLSAILTTIRVSSTRNREETSLVVSAMHCPNHR